MSENAVIMDSLAHTLHHPGSALYSPLLPSPERYLSISDRSGDGASVPLVDAELAPSEATLSGWGADTVLKKLPSSLVDVGVGLGAGGGEDSTYAA